MRTTAQAGDHGFTIRLQEDGAPGTVITEPVILEILVDADPHDPRVERVAVGYDEIHHQDGVLHARATISGPAADYVVDDEWTEADRGVRLRRRLSAAVRVNVAGDADSASQDRVVEGVRLLIEVGTADAVPFDRATFFAPPALYDLNDIDGDGVEDYLDSRTLSFREDRLSGLTAIAHDEQTGHGWSLSRTTVPAFDDIPERRTGQVHVLQATDIGALGISPAPDGTLRLTAAYPFVERDRSNALTSEAREPWGAFWPVRVRDGATVAVSYDIETWAAPRPVDLLWTVWRARAAALAPRPVELPESLETITRLRLDALLAYYAEGTGAAAGAAGFVTNCHPQDGVQLENIIQYGFTGQNVLNAHHVLQYADQLDDPDARTKALRVIDFFVAQAAASPSGLAHTLFNLDTGETASWWSGLILPLAYADDGTDLEALMGPVYEHMRYAVDPLRELDGTYLRCMAEEHAALVRVAVAERDRGVEHPAWLETARAFGEFLIEAQENDGSWRRAYGFDGSPMIEPRAWFGPDELNQKSSTATAVPFLVALAEVTGDGRFLDAAGRGERFAADAFVAGMKFNGGIHDSIYARPQLVDSESILYCMRASLAVWEATGGDDALATAVDAARILATWIWLWDVPLPPSSTLARDGFRSTGWSGCDTAGAGYVHPYEITAAPDLLALALRAEDPLLAQIAELVLVGSSETVATPTKDWGYARSGLQEEGLLISWWLIDDPMFSGTSFGGRGKGEGNKTCLPWISAVSIDAFSEMHRRFGTDDVAQTWNQRRVAPLTKAL